MAAEYTGNNRVVFQGVHRLAEACRQRADAERFPFRRCHPVAAHIHRGRRSHPATDAVQPRRKAAGQREVRVGGRVRRTQLQARPPAAVRRDTHQRAAAAVRPCDVRGRLVAGNQAFVGVHRLVAHGREGLRVAQNSREKPVGLRAQAIPARIVRVGKAVFAVFCQCKVQVHAGAVGTRHRFRHECRVGPGGLCNGFNRHLKRHDIVGGTQRRIVPEVDFVLARRRFVVRSFHLKPHAFERQANFAADIAAHVDGAEVEISRGVVRRCGGQAVLIRLK